MGYDELQVAVGRYYNGSDIYAGFRFPLDTPQGTSVADAILMLRPTKLFPAGGSFYDEFVDANTTWLENHAPIWGPSWVRYMSGTHLTIQSNQVRLSSSVGGASSARYIFEGGENNGILSANCYRSGTADSGIIFRLVGGYSNWVFFIKESLLNPPLTSIHLTLVDEPGGTQYVWSGDSYPEDAWYALEVEMSGDNIIARVNGEEVANVTNNTFSTATMHGIYGAAYDGDYALWAPPFEFAVLDQPPFTPNLEVSCEFTDDAGNFDAGGLPGGRSQTSARVALGDISDWADDDWPMAVHVEDIVHEVLHRSGWVAGNNIVLLIGPVAECSNGEGVLIESYEGSDCDAKLVVSWMP